MFVYCRRSRYEDAMDNQSDLAKAGLLAYQTLGWHRRSVVGNGAWITNDEWTFTGIAMTMIQRLSYFIQGLDFFSFAHDCLRAIYTSPDSTLSILSYFPLLTTFFIEIISQNHIHLSFHQKESTYPIYIYKHILPFFFPSHNPLPPLKRETLILISRHSRNQRRLIILRGITNNDFPSTSPLCGDCESIAAPPSRMLW